MESFLRRLNKSSNIRNLRPVNFFHKSSFPNYYLHTKSSANFSVSFPFSLQYNSQKIVNNSFSNPTRVPKQKFSHKKITKDFSNLNNKSHFSTKNKVQEIDGVLTKKVLTISEKVQNDTKNLSHAHHQHKTDKEIDNKDNIAIQNEASRQKSLNRDEHQIGNEIIV